MTIKTLQWIIFMFWAKRGSKYILKFSKRTSLLVCVFLSVSVKLEIFTRHDKRTRNKKILFQNLGNIFQKFGSKFYFENFGFLFYFMFLKELKIS